MERVLITGANGFVGRQLCRTLTEQGFEVRAAVRQAPTAPAEDVQFVGVGDIGPETDWTEALQGVDLVAHLAGRAHVMGDSSANSAAEYERVNTWGTMRLAQMAAVARVKRFLFLSSVKVNGEESHEQPFVETDTPSPKDSYGLSKLKAEEGLLQMHRQGKLAVVIVRSPLVYGPGVRANFLQLIRLVDLGIPLPLGKINNLRSLVGLRNLCNFIVTCLQHPAAAGNVFLVSDQKDLSTPDLVRSIASGLGRSGYLIPLPYKLLLIFSRIVGKKDTMTKLCHSLQVNTKKARQVLDWKPPFSVSDELTETINWYKNKYTYVND